MYKDITHRKPFQHPARQLAILCKLERHVAGGYHPSVPQAPEQALARSHSNDKLSAVERSSSRGPGRQLTPSFATLQFDQSPGKSVLAVRVQQPNVVAEVRRLDCR